MTNIHPAPIAWRELENKSSASQETIVWLHAMAGSATAWEPQISHFSNDYRCVAWDMPGFGESPDPSSNMKMAQVVDCLADFVTEQLGLKSVHFVGLSVGGMILQNLAAERPELVKSVAILSSSPKFGHGGDMKPAEFADPILAELASGTSPAVFSKGMINAIVGPDCSKEIKLEAITSMSRARVTGLALTTRLIADHDALDVLGKINCPALVIAGEKDGETPPAYTYEIASRIPGASATVIPNAGHIVNLENPEAVNARLQFFLEHSL